MLEMAVRYRAAIDDITANKALKLRKFELDDEDWEIVSDLIRVLKVRLMFIHIASVVNL
jgi:plasmid maintenance system killer protein